ncbi:MAG: RpiB/LacA/LacB family sugar-phosphate isomerase [Candidatus Omnitrophica bacterium]|nr:RpiB/LacA/LacB family sugar-phosphate isomerase [Candidatus Omnitrophota bacterium]
MTSSAKSNKIAFGCDHRGFAFKALVFEILKKNGYEVVDCGTHSEESVDYTDFIFPAAKLVSNGECVRAIGVCHSGIGSAIAANKVPGVRAALVHNVEEAGLSRAHNDANMLILGSGFMSKDILPALIEKWLKTPFEGGRHERRVDKIQKYEQNRCE